jgi:hypothetical protein
MMVAQDLTPLYALEFSRWAAVICAFVFFGFFGFADEAVKNHYLLASLFTKRLGYTTFTQSTAISDLYDNSPLHLASVQVLTFPLYSTIKSGTGATARDSLPVLITKETESILDWSLYRQSNATAISEYKVGVQVPEPVFKSASNPAPRYSYL